MTYKIRNIIVLGSFILLISIVSGYFVFFSYPNRINATQEKIENIDKKIAALDGIETEFTQLREFIREREEKIANLDKQIKTRVTSTETYYYLNTILNYVGLLDFNMLFIGSETQDGYGYNTYNIKGEGSFDKLYQFIWYIERGPQIYKINKLNIRGVENKDPETKQIRLIVPFEMEIRAYFVQTNDLPATDRSLNDVRVARVKNPFAPDIFRNLPPNTEELVEVERAELNAVVKGKALVTDHTGKIHELEEGDRIYLGYLSRINPTKNEAEFTLNKGGIVEKIVLKLRFSK